MVTSTSSCMANNLAMSTMGIIWLVDRKGRKITFSFFLSHTVSITISTHNTRERDDASSLSTLMYGHHEALAELTGQCKSHIYICL